MALFQGEDMVDVTTPDGRTLTLPRSIVPTSMLPQVAQQAPAPPPAGLPPVAAPQQQLPDAPPAPAQPAPTVEMGDPTVEPVDVVNMQPEIVPTRNAAQVQRQAAAEAKKAAAAAATPQGQLASVQNQQKAAAAGEQDALLKSADLEAAEQSVVADAVTARNAEIDKLFAARNAEAQKNALAEDAKMQEVVGLRTKIANFKVDRKHDSPVMATIGMILAGLGTAINNKTYGRNDENPALKIFYEAIDRKVNAQMADLDQMGKIYGMTKEEVQMLKDKSKSRLEFHNAMIAGETEKAIRHIEEITARSASEKTKANAKMLVAQLQQRVADKTMESTRWGLEFDQKDRHEKARNAVQYAGIAESRRHNMADEQLKREEIYADQIKAAAAAKAAGDAAAYKARIEGIKDVSERGIKGVDNDYLLTPEGRNRMAQAAALETEAAALEQKYKNDPMDSSVKSGRVELLRQKAAELRGVARIENVVKVRDTAEAKAISKKYAAAQTMMDTIDEIKMIYDQAGRGLISRTQQQQELQAKYGLLAVAAKDAWELGAWDKGSANLVASIIGKDPTDGMDVGFLTSQIGMLVGNDPEGFKKKLNAVTVKLEQDVRQQIVKSGADWDGKGELFTRKKEADLNTPTDRASADLTQAKSGVELAKDAENVGVVGRTARAVGYPFSPDHKQEAEAAQSVKYPGLSVAQEAPFETLVTAYKKGDTRAGDELVAKVANTAKERPDLAIALMHNLREQAPNLYTAARSAIPKGSDTDTQMQYEDNNAIAAAPLSTADLANMVVSTMRDDGTITDTNDYKELARRAGQKDPEAQKAIMQIVSSSNAKKTMPKGSVFRNGVR